ncbi:MAG: sedoheptulokinase [Acidobacteriota bacterium]
MARVTRPTVAAVDVGTSRIKAILYSGEEDRILARADLSSGECRVPGLPPGWSEIDPLQVVRQVRGALDEILSQTCDPAKIAALALTGCMHGVLFVSEDGQPLSNLVDWRDRRVHDAQSKLGTSVLDHFLRLHGSTYKALNTGCRPCAGYGASTLYWFDVTGALPREPAYLCTLMDFVAGGLTGGVPVTDYTLGASTGLLDVVRREWVRSLVEALGGKRIKLPRLVAAGTPIGSWQGLPVLAPVGDHAASVYAVLGEDPERAHINIGTGSQVAVCTSEPCFDDRLESRPGLTGGYLLVAAGSVGGRTLDIWRGMMAGLLGAAEPVAPSYLWAAARRIQAGCDGLQMRPLFQGTRCDPSIRCSIEGISPENFTPGHLARACLEGVVHEWAARLSDLSQRTNRDYPAVLVTGDLPLLEAGFQEIVRDELGRQVTVVRGGEVSALGAARHAVTVLASSHPTILK